MLDVNPFYEDEAERNSVWGFKLPGLMKTLAILGMSTSALDAVFDVVGEYSYFPVVQAIEMLTYSGLFYIPYSYGPNLDWHFFSTLVVLVTVFLVRLLYSVLSCVQGLLVNSDPAFSEWINRVHWHTNFLPPDFENPGRGWHIPHDVLQEARFNLAVFVMRNLTVVAAGCVFVCFLTCAYRHKKRMEEPMILHYNTGGYYPVD